MNWRCCRPIFAAAGQAGVEYHFAEQEPPIVDMTELEAAKVNFDYMRAIDPERHE